MTVEIVVKDNYNDTQKVKDLIGLQRDLFRDGYNLKEYENYIQEGIGKGYKKYVNLNEDDIKFLCKRFNKLLNKSPPDYSMSHKQRKLFRQKRKKVCYEKKRELISKLISELNKLSVRDLSILSDDPDQWNETKKVLFIGGSYLIDYDVKWCNLYNQITCQNSALMFDMNSRDDFINYVYSQ